MQTENKKEIGEAKIAFDEQIEDIERILTFNKEISDLIDDLFDGLKKMADSYNCKILVPKIEDLKGYVRDLRKYPELNAPVNLLYTQTVVLSVTSLESYLTDVFSTIVKDNPDKIIEKHKDIKINSKLLNENNFDLSNCMDEVILNIRGNSINFQDLGSTVRTFQTYTTLDMDKLIKDLRDEIILAQALRHVIVHNARKIDKKFIAQIENTKYSKKWELEDSVEVDKELAIKLITSVKNFVRIIDNEVKKV